MTSSYPVSVPHAVSALVTLIGPLDPCELPLEEAVGGVLAEPLATIRPVPDWPVALRSGYAASSADLVGVSAYAPRRIPVPPIFVEAGGPLPCGTDAVLPPDAIHSEAAYCEILTAVAPGENVRRLGEDASPGLILRTVGQTVRSRDVAIARSAGIDSARVRRVKIDVAGTATEPTVTAMVRTIEIPGARVRARDPRDDRLVEVGTSSPQLLLLLSDSGDPRSCLPQNATLVADALALRPAERTVIARLGATAIVIVPSRVDDLFALTRCILTPVVDALTFRIASEPPWLGRLAHKLSSNIGFSEVALLHETGAGLEPLAVGDLSLPALAAADGFILVPSECEGYPQGGVIEIFPILE